MAAQEKKPRTRTRAATHAPSLAAGVRCPGCGCSHCLRTQSENGMRDAAFMCGSCGLFFDQAAV